MAKKVFAIYARVSRTDQVLENQITPLIEYCNKMDWDYVVFKETESTRKTRPVQWDLYNRLLKKEFDGLLFFKLDRWARSLRELVTHMEELHSRGVNVVSYTENIDLDTPTGKLMLHFIGAFAQFERSMIRERTLAGLARARAQGKTLGRPRGKAIRKEAPINVVRNYLEQGQDYRTIASQMETTVYRIEQAVIKIRELAKAKTKRDKRKESSKTEGVLANGNLSE